MSESEPVSAPSGSGNSRPVFSSQTGVHQRLDTVLQRHRERLWQAPLHGPSEQAFAQLEQWRSQQGCTQPLVLDSGCGTGLSTQRLAARHPDALIIGIDQSAARLRRVGAHEQPRASGRVLWVRAELATIWRLARAADWPLQHHYLLYPNPWPKPAHLQRRWHAHPVFGTLLALGGRLELRSNWQIYVLEFARALERLGQAPEPMQTYLPAGQPLTPFEEKYAASGHDLWRLRCQLQSSSP